MIGLVVVVLAALVLGLTQVYASYVQDGHLRDRLARRSFCTAPHRTYTTFDSWAARERQTPVTLYVKDDHGEYWTTSSSPWTGESDALTDASRDYDDARSALAEALSDPACDWEDCD